MGFIAIFFGEFGYTTIATVLVVLGCIDVGLYFLYDNLPKRMYSGKWARSNAAMSYGAYIVALLVTVFTTSWAGAGLVFGHSLYLILCERDLRKKAENPAATA